MSEKEKAVGSNVVRISDEALKAVESLAKEKGVSTGQAATQLVMMGHSRRRALSKYSKAHRPEPTEKPKKAKAEKAPKAEKPKKAKKGKKKIAKDGAPKAKKAKKPATDDVVIEGANGLDKSTDTVYV